MCNFFIQYFNSMQSGFDSQQGEDFAPFYKPSRLG
jgi:hypothetical protein